jgi:hypothetical protein
MLKNIPSKKLLLITTSAIIFLVLIVVMSTFLPKAIDWHYVFRPAALELLHGRTPYNIDGFFNPPWTAILLMPFAVLPENIGRAVMAIVSLAVYAYIAIELGAKKISTIFVLLSPPVLLGIQNGNIDWLVALGFILPPWLGLFFLMIKPQIGMAVFVFILISSWIEGGLKKVAITFAPIGIVSIISIAIFSPWFISIRDELNVYGNTSLWPISIPIGIYFLIHSVRKNNIRYSIIASPLLSPYVLLHSWIGLLLAITPFKKLTIVAVLGLWIMVIIRLVKYYTWIYPII